MWEAGPGLRESLADFMHSNKVNYGFTMDEEKEILDDWGWDPNESSDFSDISDEEQDDEDS